MYIYYKRVRTNLLNLPKIFTRFYCIFLIRQLSALSVLSSTFSEVSPLLLGLANDLSIGMGCLEVGEKALIDDIVCNHQLSQARKWAVDQSL